MPAVTEQFVSEFIVQGLAAFEGAMKSAGGGMDQLAAKGESIGSRVTSGLGSFFSGFGANMQTLGTITLGAAGTVVGAIGGIGAAIGKLAMDAAPLKAVEGAFAGLAQSAGMGMDDMLASLQEGSSGMIANRDLMMSFNQAAQLVSVDFATQLPEAMGYLGKVAAATGQDMGFMLDSLVKGVGRVSPMILDNLGIQVNATEANEAYALSIGKSADELTKTEQQAAIMAMTLEKLRANTANMPDITNNASTSLAALKATFTNTKDEIGKAFVPVLNQVLQTILPGLQAALPVVVRFIEDFAEKLGFLVEYFRAVLSDGDWLNDWLTELPAGIQPIVKFLGELVASFGQAWQVLQSGQGPLAAIMEILDNFLPEATMERIYQFIDAVTPVIESVVAWLAENVKLQDILIALGAAIATVIIPIIGTIIGAIAPVIATFLAAVAIVALLRTAWETDFLGIQGIVAGVFAWIQTAVATLKDFWAENGDAILAKAKEVWEAVTNAISVAITTVSTIVQTVVAAIAAFWAENGDAILAKASDIWNTILTVISTVITTVSTVVQTVVGAIAAFWAANGDAILAKASDIWNTILSVISTVITTISTVVTSVVGALQEFWAAHGETIKSVAQTAWDTIQTFIQTAITVISEVIQAFISAIKGDWTAFGEHLRTAVDAVWENIKNIFRNAATNIRTVVSNLITSIKRFFTETDWGAVGKSVIQGIADGISRGVSIIADAASNAAKAALDAAKGFLGIESPSKAFRVEVGRPSGEGIALGIQDTLPIIRAQLGALVPMATEAGSVVNYSTVNNMSQAYQLTTQSLTREGALRMEFSAMAAAGRIAA